MKRKRDSSRRANALAVSFLLAASAAVGCTAKIGSGELGPHIQITPSRAELGPNQPVSFAALVTGVANDGVGWSVTESEGGAIDASGRYVAPAKTGTFHVVARSMADANLTATATVLVTTGGSSSSGGSSSGGGPILPPADCVSAALRSTVYYYCDCQAGAASGCQQGSDANTGLDVDHPRRSFSDASARFNTMASGGTVALCRGGSFSGNTEISASCTASNPCDFRDYAPRWGAAASNPRPIINGGNATILGLWNGSSGGLRFWNLDLRATGNADGLIQVLNDAHDLDICNVSFTGGYDSLNMAPTGSYDSRIQVRGSQFQDAQFCGFIGGAPGLTVTGNTFTNNGLLSTMNMHSAYLITEVDGGVPADGASANTYTFSNNVIYQGSYCDGPMVVVHGVFRNTHLLIENNDISTSSTSQNCYGFQTSGGLAGAEFHNVVFRRNRITTPGQTGAEVSCCQDCEVSSNLIVNGGLFVSTSTCSPGGFSAARVTLQNNTLYGAGLTVGSQGSSSGYVVENNAIFSTGGSCLSVAPATTRNSHNYCRTSGGVSAGTVFADAGGGDFRPANPGPLVAGADQSNFCPVAIGTLVWSATDPGATRVAPNVDIGAYQH